MGLEYYKKEVEAAFAKAALALSSEEYAELCEYLKGNGVI